MAVLEIQSYYKDNQINAVVTALLEAGAKVNSPPSEKYTSALQAAIDNKQLVHADRLLELGADVNAHDPRFGTALTAATRWSREGIMKKLLEKGADPTLAGERFGYVPTYSRPSLVSLTCSRSALQSAARGHNLEAVEHLLKLGVDPNQLSGKTGYALHAACRRESNSGTEILKLLVQHGADPNKRGGKYETALQAAAKHGCLANMKFLLSVGADPTIEGGRYVSPWKAALAGKNKHYHVANYLKRHTGTIRK